MANLPVTIKDTAERYVGFENVLTPPSNDINETDSIHSKSSTNSKLNDQLSPYPAVNFQFSYHLYVSLKNDAKIPIHGCETIQIRINGFILRLQNVFHVPDLQYNLYSVKQHKNYNLCGCYFGYKGDILAFPNFSFHIDDQDDLLIFATDVGKSTNKIYWSSTNVLQLKGAKSSYSQPRHLPSQKPNPSKNHHRRLTTIDLHHYFGFRTLKISHTFKLLLSQQQ